MNLTENEQRLFNLLKSKAQITMDEIVDEFDSSRHALGVRIKYLSAKVAAHGWIIKRTSSIGRGAKATYSMEKKF